jgi:galactokinase
MTGGGFGGSVVILCAARRVTAVGGLHEIELCEYRRPAG